MTRPFPLSTIVQHFGGNAVSFYTTSLGLKGHPGIDYGVSWGTSIPCAADGIVCAVLSPNGDPAFYRAVNTIVEENGKCYEVQYGHCSDMLVSVGEKVKVGQIIAKVGNTGTVYANGVEVSEQDKLAGSRAGSHLHFQVRAIGKEPNQGTLDDSKHYLNDGQKMLSLNGYRYYWLFDNGYNSCIDPEPLFATISPANPVGATSSPSAHELSPSDRIALLAANYMASGNLKTAQMLFALADFIKKWS